MNDSLYWVWLSFLPQIGVVKKKKLLDEFGTAYDVFCADEVALRQISYLTSTNIDAILNKKYRHDAKIHLNNVYENNIKILTIQDDSYPSLLKNIYDPPIVLYVKGKIQKQEVSIGIVGSRKATSYGLKVAYDMANKLSQNNIF